jgi:hypothetical protein
LPVREGDELTRGPSNLRGVASACREPGGVRRAGGNSGRARRGPVTAQAGNLALERAVGMGVESGSLIEDALPRCGLLALLSGKLEVNQRCRTSFVCGRIGYGFESTASPHVAQGRLARVVVALD